MEKDKMIELQNFLFEKEFKFSVKKLKALTYAEKPIITQFVNKVTKGKLRSDDWDVILGILNK